ncbi:MAG: hypothetical protein GXX96_28135 [Planctomycetaceae bacterium]|nr:hypothetical protein [Planctomycetaceae bacterium]
MHRRSPTTDRKATTLIEVLLVLALLVMLAAMTWPALDRPMADQRLRKAADRVRTAWVRARIDAMSTGRTYVFRCTFESDEYTVESQAGVESVETITSSNQGQFDDSTAVATAEPLSTRTRKLPKDIRFVEGEVTEDTRATAVETLTENTTADAGQCSDPILFFPDGTTSTATLVLESKYERRIELSLRGLTGVTTVGDTYPAEDSTGAIQQ